VPNERQLSNCGGVAAQFPLSSLFSAKVTGPTFTKDLHNVEALTTLLMHAYMKRYYIPFWNARAVIEGYQLLRLQKKQN